MKETILKFPPMLSYSIVANKDGRAEAFFVDTSSHHLVKHAWQVDANAPTVWHAPTELKPAHGKPLKNARSVDAVLEGSRIRVYAVTSDNTLKTTVQLIDYTWSDWEDVFQEDS